MFARKLILKSLYAKPALDNEPSVKEKKAIDDLVSLLEEQDNYELIGNIDLDSLLSEQITPTTAGILGKSILKKKSNKF